MGGLDIMAIVQDDRIKNRVALVSALDAMGNQEGRKSVYKVKNKILLLTKEDGTEQ